MTPAETSRLPESLSALAAPAVVAGGLIVDFQLGLLGAEAECVVSAVKKRRDEFEAGRCAARAALGKLGVAPCPILREESGLPIWPEGVVGSITHSAALCLAVCAKVSDARAVGIDVELVGRLHRRLWRLTFSGDEVRAIEACSDVALAASIAYSAKEAYQKAQFAVSGRAMGYRSMRVTAADDGTLAVASVGGDASFGALPRECRFHYLSIGDHVAVFCFFPSENGEC
jgi:enterobactin synthetase component D